MIYFEGYDYWIACKKKTKCVAKGYSELTTDGAKHARTTPSKVHNIETKWREKTMKLAHWVKQIVTILPAGLSLLDR